MTSSKILFLKCWLVLLLFSIAGCKTTDIKAKPNLLPYMKQPVAVLSAPPPNSVASIWPELMKDLETRLQKLPQLGKVTGQLNQQSLMEKNPELRSLSKRYLTTLSLTHISDKELAWKLEKQLGSPYFIVLDFISFPCSKECSSEEQWVVRLKMLEAQTGAMIYLVRLQRQLEDDELETTARIKLLNELVTEATDEFAKGFTVPWHIWRFEHLKRANNRKNRKTYGI